MIRIIVVGSSRTGKTELATRLSAQTGIAAVFDDFNHRQNPVESLPDQWIIVVQSLSDLPQRYKALATTILEHVEGFRFADAGTPMEIEP